MKITPRVADRVDRDFGDRRGQALYLIEAVDIGTDETQGAERIQAAMLIWATGNLDRLVDAAALAESDWRDLLVSAGLAGDDWRNGVDAYLAQHVTGE